MSIWITLTEEQINYVDAIAKKRQLAAIERRRPAHNNAPTDNATALAIHITGTRCEYAGKLYLNPVSWNSFAEDVKRLPDLENWIDIKGRTKDWHSLIVQKDDPDEWAYLLVCSHKHPQYLIVGWCWGREAKQKKYWSDPAGNRPAYFIKQNDPILKSPASLLSEVRKRQSMTDDSDWADLFQRLGQAESPRESPRKNYPVPSTAKDISGGIGLRARQDEQLELAGIYKPDQSITIIERRCKVCGKWACFGFGVRLLDGIEGRWSCREHLDLVREQGVTP